MVLRKQDPNRPRPFRTPMLFVVGPLAMIGCVILFLSLGWYTVTLFLIWAAIGLVVYYSYGYRRSAMALGTA